jgi:ubiquitin C-terminal hydrolase
MQGIENLGSTCAINSLIQVITRNDILRNIILNNTFVASADADATISQQLSEIIDLMYVKNNSIVPRKFIQTFYSIFKDIFYHGEQIDIGELWTFLSDKISEEIEATPKDTDTDIVLADCLTDGVIYKDDAEFHNAMIKCKLLKKKYEYYYHKFNTKTSIWQRSTQGFYLNTTRCVHCQTTFYNFEPFTSLNLDIPHSPQQQSQQSLPSISLMIANSLKEEVIHGDWFCSTCRKNTAYKKSTKLWKLPDVLVIIVKRFMNSNAKNDAPIKINDYLNFNKGSILSIKKDVVYTFSSTALHFGSLNGGHYAAICNTPDGDILYDDRNVQKIDGDRTNFKDKSETAYMVVYTVKNNE